MPNIQLRTPAGDVHSVDDSLAEYYERQGWAREATPAEIDAIVEEAHDLKGDALDEALKDAGLPRTGTAEEKRARLADHLSTPTEE